MLTSEPALFSTNIKPLCSESNNFPNLSWWHWMEPPAIFCSHQVIPYIIISKLHTAMLETSISAPTNLCTLLSSLQTTWLGILIVGGIPKVSPRAGCRGSKGDLLSSAQHNMVIQRSTAVFCPSCVKFTFCLGEDRIGASLRTEAELLPASRSGKQRRSQRHWDRWPDLLWQQLLSGTTALPQGKAGALLHGSVSGLLPGSLAPSCTLCWAVQRRCSKELHQECGAVCSWSDASSSNLGCRSQALLCAALHEADFPHHTIPSGATAGNLAPKTASVCPTTCSAHCSWVTIHL